MLSADRAAEPLEAAKSCALRLAFNGCAPAPWDARLGAASSAPLALRPLHTVHPDGGTVRHTAVVVLVGGEGRGREIGSVWLGVENELLFPGLNVSNSA